MLYEESMPVVVRRRGVTMTVRYEFFMDRRTDSMPVVVRRRGVTMTVRYDFFMDRSTDSMPVVVRRRGVTMTVRYDFLWIEVQIACLWWSGGGGSP